MSAPFKVLLFSIFVSIVLVLVVLFNFDLLQFKKTSEAQSESKVMAAKPTPQSTSAEDIDLENGKKLYDSKTCVLCHGADGKANTPMGKAVAAVDLTVKKFKANTNNMPRLDYILHVIDNGVPGTAMVSFKTQIPSDKDKLDLAGYVNSLSQQ